MYSCITTWITRSSTRSRRVWAVSTPSGAGRIPRTASERKDRLTRSSSSAARTSRARATIRSWRPRGEATTSLRAQRPQPPRDQPVELVRGGGRHDLYRWRRMAALLARDRYRGLLQHSLVPTTGVFSALPRHHPRGRGQLGRPDQPLQVPRGGPRDVRTLHPGHHRARPRQQALRRLLIGRLLVPGRTAQVLLHPPCRTESAPECYARLGMISPSSKRIGWGSSRISSRPSSSISPSSASDTQILPSLRVFSMRTSLASAGLTPAHMVRAAATAISSVGMTMGVFTGAGVVEVRAFM